MSFYYICFYTVTVSYPLLYMNQVPEKLYFDQWPYLHVTKIYLINAIWLFIYSKYRIYVNTCISQTSCQPTCPKPRTSITENYERICLNKYNFFSSKFDIWASRQKKLRQRLKAMKLKKYQFNQCYVHKIVFLFWKQFCQITSHQ